MQMETKFLRLRTPVELGLAVRRLGGVLIGGMGQIPAALSGDGGEGSFPVSTRRRRNSAGESRYFRVSPPAIHDMIKTLERNGLIERTPGLARSIRVLVRPEHHPRLE
jgi:hypothetical protein